MKVWISLLLAPLASEPKSKVIVPAWADVAAPRKARPPTIRAALDELRKWSIVRYLQCFNKQPYLIASINRLLTKISTKIMVNSPIIVVNSIFITVVTD